MKTIEIKLYEFEELSKKVQDKVLENLRYLNVEFFNWWEDTVDTFKEELGGRGFEDAEIFFSGFSSQGDGACFDAKVNAEKLIKETFTEFSDLLPLIESGDLSFHINKNSYGNHYSHENTRYVDFDISSDPSHEAVKMAEELAEKINALRKELSHNIYRVLEQEYESLTSDVAVTETIEANQYTFEENGKMRNA